MHHPAVNETPPSQKTALQQRMDCLRITEADFEEQFSRSSGPGGQHVNKVSTAVTLRYRHADIAVTVQDSRSQSMNRQLARERLVDAIEASIEKRRSENRSASEKKRRQNRKRPHGLKMRILEGKKKRSGIKKLRSKVDD